MWTEERHFRVSTMAAIDPKREDLPRISADTIQDWQRVKSNYKNALVTSVDDRLAAQGLSKERELVLLHLDQVRFAWLLIGLYRLSYSYSI